MNDKGMRVAGDVRGAALSFSELWPWVLLVLVATTAPYLAAWWLAPAGKAFAGALVNPDDFSVYLSAMRQGANGSWLFHFTFSPEPWQPKLMLVPYIVAAKLQALFAQPSAGWLHLWRLLFALLAMYLLAVWVRTLFPRAKRRQLTAWLLIVFGGGLGWLSILFLPDFPPPDLLRPEWTTFMAFFHTPHFALGVGLEVLFFACLVRAVEGRGQRKWIFGGALAGIGVALTYVYHIPVAGLVAGLYLLARAWQQKGVPWSAWRRGAFILAPLALFLIYYAVWAYRDPFFAAYAREEHVIPPPPPAAVLIGLGLVGLMAASGLRGWFQQGKSWLVPIWAAVNLAVLYVPGVDFSGRFALGTFTPIATLAGYGLEAVILPALARSAPFGRFARLSPTPYASLRRMILLLAVPSTLFLPLWTARTAVTATGFPYFLPHEEIQALEWLGAHSDGEDVYLAGYPAGNYLPRTAPGKVFVGQLDYTTDLDEKLALLQQFWSPETSPVWRRRFLRAWNISFVYVGAYERSQMAAPIDPPGEIAYREGGTVVYRVTP